MDKVGDVYNIKVVEKTAENNTLSIGVEERLQLWDVWKQSLSSIGIDADSLSPEVKKVINAYFMPFLYI